MLHFRSLAGFFLNTGQDAFRKWKFNQPIESRFVLCFSSYKFEILFKINEIIEIKDEEESKKELTIK